MIIYGFDCATENLGICVVDYDEQWREKTSQIIILLNNLYSTASSLTKKQFMIETIDILKKINNMLDGIISIKWFNCIDLIPGNKIEDVSVLERTRRLKYMLCAMDKQLDKPDLVLIEYQMGPNDIARMVSAQISYHYYSVGEINIIPKTVDIRGKRKKNPDIEIPKNTITYAVKEYPLIPLPSTLPSSLSPLPSTSLSPLPSLPSSLSPLSPLPSLPSPLSHATKVELVLPGLKNTCYLNEKGNYTNFIVKYSNTTANKKHTDWNFSYFVEHMMDKQILENIPNKSNDMADAFMQIFSYLKKNRMI